MPIKAASIVRFVLWVIAATLVFRFVFGTEPPAGKKSNFRRPKFNKKLSQHSEMADKYLEGVATRRSIYALSKKSTISDDRLQQIVHDCIKHTPSSFNSQTGRVVILLKDQHEQLWDFGDAAAQEALPKEVYSSLAPKIAGERAAYGSILFFEDEEVVDGMKAKHPDYPFSQWSEHSSGMLQIHVWDAIELEGLGGNLQHYNFLGPFSKKVKEHWKLPEKWDLKSQLVFGTPTGAAKDKAFAPIEDNRLFVYGK